VVGSIGLRRYKVVKLPDFDIGALMGVANAFFYGAQLVGNQGAVMGKLGMFPFFMHHNDFKQIQEQLRASFSSYKPIKGQEVLGDSGGFGRNITLDGVLVAEPIDDLKALKWMLMMREPIRLTTIDDDLEVVIEGLTITKSNFKVNGEFTVQRYNLQLKEVYGELV